MPQRSLRLNLWNKNPSCFVCKNSIEEFIQCTLEHIVPLLLGGRDHKRNLAISHSACNSKRGNIRCLLVHATLPRWKEEGLKTKWRRKKIVTNCRESDERKQLSKLVQVWKVKLRQQFLDDLAKKKSLQPKSTVYF